tara:strand:+ start:950 stop:1738 length:789 start_codon:yes stop_codon:yes gene_type:complete
MAVNVDTVYKTVLYILNKEQRGYITPDEFNKLGTQVQLEIFESYFESLTQQLRVGGNSSDYADRVKKLQEKIDRFFASEALTVTQGLGEYWAVANLTTLGSGNAVHRLGNIEYTEHRDAAISVNELPVQLEEVTQQEFNLARRSKLTRPSSTWPMFYIVDTFVRILPANVTSAVIPRKTYTINYIRKPLPPIWDYTVGAVGQYVFDPVGGAGSTSRNFEIDSTDQTDIILKILQYCGVIIRDPQIIQAAGGLIQQDELMEKS